jgi:hypothetical protein
MRDFLFWWQFYVSATCSSRFRAGLLLLAGLLTLVNCDPRPAQHTEVASPPALRAAAKPAPSVPASPPPTEPAEPPPLKLINGDTIRYRRYVGTLGTRRVVVELFAGLNEFELTEPSYWGRYYDAQRGTTKEFANVALLPRKRLRLTANTFDSNDSTEHWQLRQPFGPWLTGTVTAADRSPRRVTLREDYTAAVPLAIRSAGLYGDSLRFPDFNHQDDTTKFQYFTGGISRRYVQLLGRAARRPALQDLVRASRPARLQAQLREEFDAGVQVREFFTLYLNDYGILSYGKYVSDYGVGANHPDAAFPFYTFDLHTGRPITLASLLRPSRIKALRRLLLPHLQAVDEEALRDRRKQVNTLTYDDLENIFTFSSEDLLIKAVLGSHAEGPTTITIPYPALRPLLRPRTPLNRVLVARGLKPVL